MISSYLYLLYMYIQKVNYPISISFQFFQVFFLMKKLWLIVKFKINSSSSPFLYSLLTLWHSNTTGFEGEIGRRRYTLKKTAVKNTLPSFSFLLLLLLLLVLCLMDIYRICIPVLSSEYVYPWTFHLIASRSYLFPRLVTCLSLSLFRSLLSSIILIF